MKMIYKKLLSLILAVSIVSFVIPMFKLASAEISTDVGTTRSIPITAQKFGNNYYQVYFDSEIGWHDAKTTCENLGGHLATISSEEENNFIFSLVRDAGIQCWLGATDEANEGVWKWVTNEAWSYDNGSYDNRGGVQHYLVINYSGDSTWDDQSEKSTSSGGFYCKTGGYVCEWDANTPADAVEFNGHYYKIYDESITWTEAKLFCENLGGHLVTITSKEEQDFLTELSVFSSKKNLWIGAYIREGEYCWITDEKFFQYTNWDNGEPNNVYNSQFTAMMYTQKSSMTPGKWNDENENGRNWEGYYLSDFGFICEWDANIPVTPEICTVTLYGFDGEIYMSFAAEEGETVDLTNYVPEREGYCFLGWVYNSYDTESFVMPGCSVDVYSIWGRETHNAIFKVKDENGNIIDTITVPYEVGETIVAPVYDKVGENQTFSGWTIPEGTTMGTSDMVFEATIKNINEAREGFQFYSEKSTNTFSVGDKINLYAGYYSQGKLDENAKDFVFTISDGDVIDIIKEKWDSQKGLCYSVKAKSEGYSSVTFTNVQNNDSYVLEFYVFESESAYNFYNLPGKYYEKDKLTNFYNYSGMVINEFDSIPHETNGIIDYYLVSMDIYSNKNLYGAVTSYDKDGNIAGYRIIDKKSELASSFTESVEEFVHQTGDLFHLFGNKYYYSGKSATKKTEVRDLVVPVGGHITVSNNVTNSEVALIANIVKIVVDGFSTIKDFTSYFDSKSQQEKIVELTTDMITGKIIANKLGKKLLSTAGKTLNEMDFSYNNMNEFVDYVGKRFVDYNFDLLKEIEESICTVTGIGEITESIVKTILPTGFIIDILYASSDALDYMLFNDEFSSSGNNPEGISIYAPSDSNAWISNGISISPKNGDMDNEIVAHSYILANEASLVIDDEEWFSEGIRFETKYTPYNITLYRNGKESQPDSMVVVKIPVPDGYRKGFIKVFRSNGDGSLTDMKAYIEGDYAVFETNHFSYYILAEIMPKILIKNPSVANINYGDKIILHADIEGELPSGYQIKWISSNNNFSMSVSDDGKTCTISPESSGDTVFTAVIVDENDNTVSSDEQTMTSKAGFFQKIIAFFKKLFGLTKTIPQFKK